MLSPTQKNLSDDDSSGSDAGSEVSVEPETDRFGFILTNGSSTGNVGPPPELVRQREAKWIDIIHQWDRILLKKPSKVKVQCQKGIPASLRAKCWPLLCGATDKMKQNSSLYQSLDSQPALQSWVDVIERDLDRQFPFHEMFLSKDGHGQRGLFRVLKAYTQYQPEEGYCQAQGPVAAVLLMNMPVEEAFWCLVQISEQYLPGYYSPLLEGVLFDAALLARVLKTTCPAAYKHLQHHGVEPLMFATDWLMCLFTRHLPFNTLLRVWDLFFCYGVRVLLQVAVVLVRRVLGRAEQRKQCQGQMETLEKLRAIREQVQEEDDIFVVEVCSVPLSARDLEKLTTKELKKWRKDKPSSTFDPRGRCQGYRMVLARVQYNKEEWERKEREKGNLSVPLARSASTLSLSPSLLHKKWRKGGKVNTGEWEGGGKVVRHLSMGAKEDWRSWNDFHFKKVQGVQEEEDIVSEEDTVSEEQKNQSEFKLTPQTEGKELLEDPKTTDKIQNKTEHIEEIVKEQTEEMETRILSVEREESQLKEAENTKMLSEVREETNIEPESNQDPAKDQTVENILQPSEHSSQHEQGEKLDSTHSQVEEQQDHKGQDQEILVKDTNEETKKVKVAESEHTVAVDENQSEIQKDGDSHTNANKEMQVGVDSSEEQMTQVGMKPEETETKNVQQKQVDTATDVSETRTETSLGSETDTSVEAPDPDHTAETETQQQQEEVVTETDKNSGKDASEVKYPSPESLAETETTKEAHAQTETDTDVLTEKQEEAAMRDEVDEVEAEIVKLDSEQNMNSKTETTIKAETFILSSPECIQQQEVSDTAANTETPPGIPAACSTVAESTEAFAQYSEKDCDTVASEPTQEKEERIFTAHSEAQADNDQTQAEETPAEKPATVAPPHTEGASTQADNDQTQAEETPAEKPDTVAPPHTEGASTQAEAENLTAESDVRTCSVETRTSDEFAPEQLTSQVAISPVEEERSENIPPKTVGKDIIIISTSNVTDSPHAVSIPQVRNKDHIQAEANTLTQAFEHCSNRSSGDFCVRKSSSTHGSRLARRLSEDLFTTPQKTSQSQPILNHPDMKHSESQPQPGAVNPTQTPPNVTQSSEAKPPLSTDITEGNVPQQQPQAPPKRFGLFRRLKREQPKKAKEKETQKMQVPKILIQDFSDGTGMLVEEEGEEKLSSRERRRQRRERERREKEEAKSRKKKEKELEKEREQGRRKPQTRGKSFQGHQEKSSNDVPQSAKTGSQTRRCSVSYAEYYF